MYFQNNTIIFSPYINVNNFKNAVNRLSNIYNDEDFQRGEIFILMKHLKRSYIHKMYEHEMRYYFVLLD